MGFVLFFRFIPVTVELFFHAGTVYLFCVKNLCHLIKHLIRKSCWTTAAPEGELSFSRSQHWKKAAKKYTQRYLQLERRVLMIFHEKRGKKQSFFMTQLGVSIQPVYSKLVKEIKKITIKFWMTFNLKQQVMTGVRLIILKRIIIWSKSFSSLTQSSLYGYSSVLLKEQSWFIM